MSIGVHIKDLAAFRALDVMQEVRDPETGQFTRSPVRQALDGVRTPVAYEGGNKDTATQSFAIVRSLDEVVEPEQGLTIRDLIEAYPGIATSYELWEIAGYRRQVEIDGVPQWDTVVDEDGGERRVPVMENVAPDPEARAAYRACWDFETPVPVLDEDGNQIDTRTPPFWVGWIANYGGPELLE